MARTWNDDLDGRPATENVTFALRGIEYEVDLCDDNAERLDKALQDFITAGRQIDPSTRDAVHAQTRAFLGALHPSGPPLAIEAVKPADLDSKQDAAAFVKLEFKPGYGEEDEEPAASEPASEQPPVPAPAAAPAPGKLADGVAKPSDVAKTLAVKPPPAKQASGLPAMDIARASQLAVNMTKAERDVVRTWAKKQLSDPELCNIGNMGRLPAYAVLKWAEAHTPVSGKKP